MTTDQADTAAPVHRTEYVRPPIAEALCQFNFASPLAWSPITPGMFFELIRAEYPTEPEVQQQVQANVQFPKDAAGSAQFTMGQGDQRLIYRNESANRLVVLSPSSISANSLPPYEGWPALSARLQRTLSKTTQVLKGAEVGAVTVRYINRILVPRELRKSREEMFNVPFRSIGGGGTHETSLFQRIEATLDDGVSQAILTFASVELLEGETDGEAYLLDFEFRRTLDRPIGFDDAMNVAHELKSRENAEFEACITDATRGLFR